MGSRLPRPSLPQARRAGWLAAGCEPPTEATTLRRREAAALTVTGVAPEAQIGDTRLMPAPDMGTPRAVAAALAEAMNAHDIDSFVSLFAPDYDSRQPVHPDRAFVGRDQVRANWSAVFSGVPDFRAELVATAVESDTLWSEWRWRGTHEDGSRLDMAGVIVCGVQAGMLTWARLYVEPVVSGGEGIEATVREMSGRD
jgi:ketosteroid isomerase-like protein